MTVRMRQAVERAVVKAAVMGLLDAGYTLRVDYDRGYDSATPWTTDRKTLFAALFACDEEWIMVRKGEGNPQDMTADAFVFLVYGNDGWDVISNYSVSLEPALAKADKVARRFE